MSAADPMRSPSGVLSDAQRAELRAFCRQEVAGGERVAAAAFRKLQRSALRQVSYPTFSGYFRTAVEEAAGGSTRGQEAAATVIRLPSAAPEATGGSEPVAPPPQRKARSAPDAPTLRMVRGDAEFVAEWRGGEWQVSVRGPLANDTMLKWAALFQLEFFPGGASR